MTTEARAFIEGAKDAVRRVIADLRDKAEQSEQLRSAEHRAFMAEQREALALLTRQVGDRIAAVRDGTDGKDGAPGEKGEPGDDGKQGLQGERGEQGDPGRDGADGEQGPQGDPGVQGERGADGADGEQGAAGERGEKGEPGVQGERGADGEAGERGADGAEGREGPAGERGEVGEKGDTGEQGGQGDRGDRGDTGTDGAAGRDGLDAYPGKACGLYDPEATYRALDVVSFNGCEWRAKQDDPGELPGAGWMLSASRGKRGDRGERGLEGARGKDGAAVIAGFVDPKAMQLTLTRDDGEELKVDLYEFADLIRQAG